MLSDRSAGSLCVLLFKNIRSCYNCYFQELKNKLNMKTVFTVAFHYWPRITCQNRGHLLPSTWQWPVYCWYLYLFTYSACGYLEVTLWGVVWLSFQSLFFQQRSTKSLPKNLLIAVNHNGVGLIDAGSKVTVVGPLSWPFQTDPRLEPH